MRGEVLASLVQLVGGFRNGTERAHGASAGQVYQGLVPMLRHKCWAIENGVSEFVREGGELQLGAHVGPKRRHAYRHCVY